MARKRSMETINKELDRLENREKSLQTDIDSVKSEKEKLLGERNEILEKERREQVDKLAEIVYEYFGESIVPDKLKEALEYVFAIDEVKNFIKSENAKTKPISVENNTVENIEMEACRLIRQNRKYKNLTFTFEEWERIEKLSSECKMRSATYIKQMALNGRVINIDLKNYHTVISELNKIGSNINQIARVANASGYFTHDELRQLEFFRREICRISKLFLSEIQLQAA